jgi:hypothetical protein
LKVGRRFRIDSAIRKCRFEIAKWDVQKLISIQQFYSKKTFFADFHNSKLSTQLAVTIEVLKIKKKLLVKNFQKYYFHTY